MTNHHTNLRDRAELAEQAIDGALTQLRRVLNDESEPVAVEDYAWIVGELRKAIDSLSPVEDQTSGTVMTIVTSP